MIGATKPRANIESKHARAQLRVLVQQGGGALGAYQAGVYERLAAAKLGPTRWSGFPSALSMAH